MPRRLQSSSPVSAEHSIRRMPDSKDESGSSLVEAAVAVPFLVLVVLGIIQYGFLFAAYITIRSTAQVAARYAAILDHDSDPQDEDIENWARGTLGPLLDPNALTLTRTTVNIGTLGQPGYLEGATQIELDYDLPLFFPWVVPGANGNGTFTINAFSIMR